MPVLLDERTPTWASLRLDSHVWREKAALVPYFALMACLWLKVLHVWTMGDTLFSVAAWTFALIYLFLVAEAFYIQKVMHDSAVYRHAAWQIVVGAVLLNPCALGWWMPVSVLLAAGRVQGELNAFHAKRAAEARPALEVTSVEARPVGISWKTMIRGGLLTAILLALLALAWHLAQAPKP